MADCLRRFTTPNRRLPRCLNPRPQRCSPPVTPATCAGAMRRGSRTPNAQAAVDVTNPLHAAPVPTAAASPPASGAGHGNAPPVPQRSSSSLGSDDSSSASRAPPPLPQRRPSTVVRRLHAELGLQSDGRGRGIVPLVTPPKGNVSAASPAATTAAGGGGGTGAGAGAGAGHSTDKGPPATAAASVLAAGKSTWLYFDAGVCNCNGIRVLTRLGCRVCGRVRGRVFRHGQVALVQQCSHS